MHKVVIHQSWKDEPVQFPFTALAEKGVAERLSPGTSVLLVVNGIPYDTKIEKITSGVEVYELLLSLLEPPETQQ